MTAPVHTFEVSPHSYPVTLSQSHTGYTVTYGADIRSGLDCSDACLALGAALMHALACAGTVTVTDDDLSA